jgi:hypothetical protein
MMKSAKWNPHERPWLSSREAADKDRPDCSENTGRIIFDAELYQFCLLCGMKCSENSLKNVRHVLEDIIFSSRSRKLKIDVKSSQVTNHQ